MKPEYQGVGINSTFHSCLPLARIRGRFYCRFMKKISILLAIFLAVPLFVRAQDAATEEQLNKLRADVSALQASNVELQKRLSDALKELQEVRELATKPTGNYASPEDVKQLAEKIRDVDRQRLKDIDLVTEQLNKIAKSITSSSPGRVKKEETPKANTETPSKPETGYEYVIKSGDTLSAVVAAYNKEGVKITIDQLLKANPGLKAESLKVGQKIFIPAPTK